MLLLPPQRRGDFVIYGKPVSCGACAREGVAQIINDHSAILPAEKKEAHLASLGGARAAAHARADGRFNGGGMGSDQHLDAADAALGSVSMISKAMREYITRASHLNNVAMVRARGALAPRARWTMTPPRAPPRTRTPLPSHKIDQASRSWLAHPPSAALNALASPVDCCATTAAPRRHGARLRGRDARPAGGRGALLLVSFFFLGLGDGSVWRQSSTFRAFGFPRYSSQLL